MGLLFGRRCSRLDKALGGLIAGERGLAWGCCGAAATLTSALWMWGFTVDDALISIRYARHLSAGAGWRFNLGGGITDGVTPLAWPLVLAPMAVGADALTVLARAKALGLVCWTVAGFDFGRTAASLAGARGWAIAAVLATVALSVPLAAHAVSGMETSLATLLATLAVLRWKRPAAAAVLSGMAAALRPELAAWAGVLAVGFSLGSPSPGPQGTSRAAVRAAAVGCLALLPFVGCAVVRALVWGRPVPLALAAKPSDAAHGLAYVGAALVVSLVPILALAPVGLTRTPPGFAIALAAAAHACALIFVGGDWMPYARLWVPVAPSIAYASLLAAEHVHPAATAARCVGALSLGLVLVARGGTRGREVGPSRIGLITQARPWLEGARRVASLDVGWVSAATEADLIDLAGVTDPTIAFLRGGHTSKQVSAMFLLERDPDIVLLYAPTGLPGGHIEAWRDVAYTRAIEARLASDDVIARHFTAAAWLALGANGAGYVVLKRVAP